MSFCKWFCMVLPVLVLVAVVVECSHTFMGTSVYRQLVFQRNLKYGRNSFTKRIENFNYTLPANFGYGRSIQHTVHFFWKRLPIFSHKMRFCKWFCMVLPALVLAVVVVECSHTFMGTSVYRQLVTQRTLKFSRNTFTKRIEYFNYTLPDYIGYGRTIQGILAYDLTNSSASANVTAGGIGFPHVSLRMKSDRGKDIRYDVYIYA